MARSVGLIPAALTLILICPSPGSASGTPAHFSTSGGPYPVITIALGMAAPSSPLSNVRDISRNRQRELSRNFGPSRDGGAFSGPRRAPVDRRRKRALLDDVGVHAFQR